MQKNLLRMAKLLVSLALVWAIWSYFGKIEGGTWDGIWERIKHAGFFIFVFGAVVSLINWGIEAKKWQLLVTQLEFIPFRRAWKSTCAGAAISNILPFRIGEYLGRLVYITKENRIPAIFNSVFGSTVQLAVSMLFGIPASLVMLDDNYRSISMWAIGGLAAILVLFGTVFFISGRLHSFRKKWLNRLIEDIRKFDRKQILQVCGLSLLRYGIFSSFYVFLLLYFGVINNAFNGYCAVATIYLIQSFAPSMLLTDAGLRTGIPLMVIKVGAALQPSLLAAAIINYFFNVLFPALIGLYYLVVEKIRNA